ncbi:MAG: glutamyl-tRNA reductase [Bacteroidales bacterium]|nr:glutamyl-tRNA reductase [Bacteroidales bacterium]
MTVHCKQIDHGSLDISEREAAMASFEREAGADAPGSVTLRTCNRLEVYSGGGIIPPGVARHLMRVASGLESQLIGERAVGGQVREAYMDAKAHSPLSGELHKLFESAIHAGKRVRSETRVSSGAVSHSLAAVEILTNELNDLQGARIAVIGVNKLTADVLKFLLGKGARMIQLANRSEDKARALGGPLGIKVRPLSERRDILAEADALISATSAPHLIVKAEDVPPGKRLLAIDLAFPRDIDPRLRQRAEVTLYDLDDIAAVVGKNIKVRQSEAAKAERIIDEEVEKLMATVERMHSHTASQKSHDLCDQR